MPGIARFALVSLDCPDPVSLARFYSAVTGWDLADEDGEWVDLCSDGGAGISFQRVADYRPPEWPGQDHPQQMHIDFEVDDLDLGEEQVLALGARKAEVQPGTTFRVFLDPAGHPFCLVRAG